MSYLQIDIGGKLRGLKFSQGTNMLLQDKLADMDETERKAFGVQFIIWAGLKTNSVIKGERLTKTESNPEYVDGGKQPVTIEVPVTIEDVFEWYEKLTPLVVMQVVDLYTEVNAAVPEKEADTEEKKSLAITDTEQSVINSDVVD